MNAETANLHSLIQGTTGRLVSLSTAQAEATHAALMLVLERLSRIERQLQTTDTHTTTETNPHADL
ncbi:hypothetical protein [Halochromatium roseum]|uniref:hypothetical protein n=1 Tax=Halochromatium roseum TaxID=391920 RepID=UPI001911E0FC|nr:hypothetical protein [Halochromatium roseum]MBK5938133.1 hypothetical protein [Halochromatium roseum]